MKVLSLIYFVVLCDIGLCLFGPDDIVFEPTTTTDLVDLSDTNTSSTINELRNSVPTMLTSTTTVPTTTEFDLSTTLDTLTNGNKSDGTVITATNVNKVVVTINSTSSVGTRIGNILDPESRSNINLPRNSSLESSTSTTKASPTSTTTTIIDSTTTIELATETTENSTPIPESPILGITMNATDNSKVTSSTRPPKANSTMRPSVYIIDSNEPPIVGYPLNPIPQQPRDNIHETANGNCLCDKPILYEEKCICDTPTYRHTSCMQASPFPYNPFLVYCGSYPDQNYVNYRPVPTYTNYRPSYVNYRPKYKPWYKDESVTVEVESRHQPSSSAAWQSLSYQNRQVPQPSRYYNGIPHIWIPFH